jgi:hypothetical protein
MDELTLQEIEDLNACIRRTKALYIKLIKEGKELIDKRIRLIQNFEIDSLEIPKTYEDIINSRLFQEYQIKLSIEKEKEIKMIETYLEENKQKIYGVLHPHISSEREYEFT